MGRQSKTEIDMRRLLAQCESMASEAQHVESKVDWRLSKYLECLSRQIETLEKDQKIKISDDLIRDYKRKVEFLKNIVKADEVVNPLERTLLCQHLLPSSVIGSCSNPEEKETNLQSKQLHLQAKSKLQKDLRKELFGDTERHPHSVRKRKGNITEDTATKDNIDDIIKHHHNMQEKVAEEMIRMAQSMKHNSLIARDIILADNIELERSTKVVDKNFTKLKVESDRLEELNNKRCSWVIWIMLAVVCLVFINMIIFIKFFPKRRR